MEIIHRIQMETTKSGVAKVQRCSGGLELTRQNHGYDSPIQWYTPNSPSSHGAVHGKQASSSPCPICPWGWFEHGPPQKQVHVYQLNWRLCAWLIDSTYVRYHWAIIIGPKKENDRSCGIQLHVKELPMSLWWMQYYSHCHQHHDAPYPHHHCDDSGHGAYPWDPPCSSHHTRNQAFGSLLGN